MSQSILTLTNKENTLRKSKITYPWTLLKEPKFISAMWATLYSIFIANGIILVAFTPGDLITRNGISISLITGGLLVIGGLCGVISLHGGQWFIERAGILFSLVGLLGYSVLVWIFESTIQEEILRTLFSIGLCCTLLARFYKIRGLTLDPYKV